jgi:hypothetical protein
LNGWLGIVTLQKRFMLWTPTKYSERASEPALGSDDGKGIFESTFAVLKSKAIAAAA